jgi:hypothetical protein
MKGCVLTVAVVLAIAAPAAAKNLKVYIFVAAQAADGFQLGFNRLAVSLAKVKGRGLRAKGPTFAVLSIPPISINRGLGHHRGHDNSRGNAGRLASRPDQEPRPRADVPNGS